MTELSTPARPAPPTPETDPTPSAEAAAPGAVDAVRVAELTRELLVALGQDPDREGLQDTPHRVARWWQDFLEPDPSTVSTTFAESCLDGQLVVVGGMNTWSLCEHHLLPMRLTTTVGYLPSDRVLGLSKFGRIARRHSGQLQVQERFTRELLGEVSTLTASDHVAAAVHGEHMCMSMRGVRMEQARTTTVLARGRLKTDPALAQQFLALARTPTCGGPM